MFDTLFPHNLSPFVSLAISKPIEDLLSSETFLELFSSPSFQAIVKFKWHTFVRWRFCGIFFAYLIYFGLFTAATSNTTANRKLMIASTTISGAFSLFIIRHIIILMMNHVSIRYFLKGSTYFIISVHTLPFITEFLEIIGFLKHGDYILPYLRSITILLLWIGLFVFLSAFKYFGVLVIGKNRLNNIPI